ncbi:MAG: DUF1499 domain-containing protein [Cyanobacteria bacterium J06638_20]
MLNFLRGWLVVLMLWLSLAPPAMAYANPTVSFVTPSLHLTSEPIAMAGKKSLFSFSGNRPANLGIKDGSLAACPGSPNCVNSQTSESDTEHAIAPLGLSGSAAEAIARLTDIVTGMERTEIIEQTDNYLYAEFTSALMGYVDDVEFFADDASGVVHMRSASRLGQSDLGVNRKRIEAIRSLYDA